MSPCATRHSVRLPKRRGKCTKKRSEGSEWSGQDRYTEATTQLDEVDSKDDLFIKCQGVRSTSTSRTTLCETTRSLDKGRLRFGKKGLSLL